MFVSSLACFIGSRITCVCVLFQNMKLKLNLTLSCECCWPTVCLVAHPSVWHDAGGDQHPAGRPGLLQEGPGGRWGARGVPLLSSQKQSLPRGPGPSERDTSWCSAPRLIIAWDAVALGHRPPCAARPHISPRYWTTHLHHQHILPQPSTVHMLSQSYCSPFRMCIIWLFPLVPCERVRL